MSNNNSLLKGKPKVDKYLNKVSYIFTDKIREFTKDLEHLWGLRQEIKVHFTYE